eukprot:tig00020553_g10634.t1
MPDVPATLKLQLRDANKDSKKGKTKPLDIGLRLRSKWRDDQYHVCEILDKREINGEWEYYVHYPEFNRRLDEWVKLDRFEGLHVLEGLDGEAFDKALKQVTRTLKRKHDDASHSQDHHEELDPASLKEHEEATRVKNISRIEFGRHLIETWYYSPFPGDFEKCDIVYVCEYCLKFLKRREQLVRHMKKCQQYQPPGNEIYRDGNLSMFEVDGAKQKIYCQNLCFIAKLFLDHKTLYYDVDPFLFYVLCECDQRGAHLVGYFSKEKNSPDDFNLACIMTMPPHQRKGYGKFLIEFSYELSKRESKVGTPERPLSDLGKVSYQSYWSRVLLKILDQMLKDKVESVSIKDLSEKTSFKTEDIVQTLQKLGLIKYHKGQHIVSVSKQVIEEHCKGGRQVASVNPDCLEWTPPPKDDKRWL